MYHLYLGTLLKWTAGTTIECFSSDVKTWKTIHCWIPQFFQFMSKIKSVPGKHIIMILWCFVYTKKANFEACSFLKTYVSNKQLDKNVWGLSVCGLRRRTKCSSIAKLCLPQAFFYSWIEEKKTLGKSRLQRSMEYNVDIYVGTICVTWLNMRQPFFEYHFQSTLQSENGFKIYPEHPKKLSFH